MVIVVYGGNASGKSALAEELAEKLFLRQSEEDEKSGDKVYLATMQRDGSTEAEERIAKHRELRDGKGFVTVECPANLVEHCQLPENVSTVLLEDVGNLVANELFSGEERAGNEIVELESAPKRMVENKGKIFSENEAIYSQERKQRNIGETNVSEKEMKGIVEEVCSEINWLISQIPNAVIVTNNIFDGGIEIDKEMRKYSDTLGAVNQWLAKRCDVFAESVCGLPNVLKGQSLFEEINR